MRRSFTTVVALALSLAAGAATAQTITGQVTDNTGGILPGVTVEASSPALIEGSRVAFTDGAGRYTLIDLRPGLYTLTFSLPGFSTVVVEGQDLPADFTATVNAELSVGALEETVTVSGQAPLVDVQSTARAEVLDREILDAIPTGNTLQSTAQLITGIKMNRPEVGLTTAAQQTYMSVHGMSPSQVTIQVDGQNMNSIGGDGAVQSYHNHLANQEMVYETSGMSAETSGGGVRINMVPREGGNQQSGQLWFGGSHDSLQRDGLESLSDEVQARGVTSTEGISMMYDMNLVHGGPLVRDRFWYFGSVRNFQIDKKVTNSFWRFDPNGSVPGNWYFAAPRWFDPRSAEAGRHERHRADPGHRREHDLERPAAADLPGEPEQQVLGAHRPGLQGALRQPRLERRHRHRRPLAGLADLLHRQREVDLDAQQPPAARGGLLHQRRELEPAGSARRRQRPRPGPDAGTCRGLAALPRDPLLRELRARGPARRSGRVQPRHRSVVRAGPSARPVDRVPRPVPLGPGDLARRAVQLQHRPVVRHRLAQHQGGHQQQLGPVRVVPHRERRPGAADVP